MSWLLNIIYATLLAALSPVILWRNLRHGRYRQGWTQKLFGALPVSSPDRPVVWFHAVSVGEILQLQKVVEIFRGQTGDAFNVVVTTSTDTGYELAATRFDGCTVTWFPLDFSWAVSDALRRVNPSMVVLMELELWPNFLNACSSRNIPTALINARMSDRSFAGYSRIRRLIAPVFRQFCTVGVQSAEYAQRLKQLGCHESAVHVTGSIKFDGVLTDRENPKTRELRSLFGIGDKDLVFIAGSTQEPEEETAVQTWHSLRVAHPEFRLVLVPRHRERFDAVAQMVVDSGCKLRRRSQMKSDNGVPTDTIILLDTIGELSACWGLADIAFVGGSFGSRGGQNMLEPAAYGAAVMFGPNTWNFRDIVARLKTAEAAVQIADAKQMLSTVQGLLQDPQQRRRLGTAAQNVVLSQQGAIAETVGLLTDVMSQTTERTGQKAAA